MPTGQGGGGSAHVCGLTQIWPLGAVGGKLGKPPLLFGSPLPSSCMLPLKFAFVPFPFLQSKPGLEGLLEMAFHSQGH